MLFGTDHRASSCGYIAQFRCLAGSFREDWMRFWDTKTSSNTRNLIVRIPNDTTAISLTDSSNRAWEVAKSRHSPNGMGWWNFTTYPIKETSQTHQTQHFGDFFWWEGDGMIGMIWDVFFLLYYFDVKTGRQTDRQT